MSRLRLTLACGVYDRTDALRTGDVSPEGIDLNFLAIEAPRETVEWRSVSENWIAERRR